MTFAADVVRGDANADECVFLAMKSFEPISTNLLAVVEKQSRKIRSNPGRPDHDA